MDPLKPFTSIIRSFWEQSTRRTGSAQRVVDASTGTPSQRLRALDGPPAIQTLHGRLQARMANLGQWDASRARQLFVECVLMSELGDDLARDPAFASIVQRVSQQLDSDAKLSTRLDHLLRRVAAGETVP